MKDVGLFLKNKRLEGQLTQDILAQSLGVSPMFVSKWERGICLPPMEKLKSLCTVLNIPTDDMIAKLMDLQRKRISKLLSI